MKRKTLIKRFEDELSKKKCKKIRLLGERVDFYPSKENPKEGLVVSWDLDERIAKYFYNYYNTRDVIFEDGTVIKGVDEYYPQIIVFTVKEDSNKSITDNKFDKYSIYIRNPDKSVNDWIYIKDEDYIIQRKDDIEKINGLFMYISEILMNKKVGE